jgi:hypothetical protein
MPRKQSRPKPLKRPGLTITNQQISALTIPKGRGEFRATPPAPEPVTPKPRQRVGERVVPSERVVVTNPKASG